MTADLTNPDGKDEEESGIRPLYLLGQFIDHDITFDRPALCRSRTARCAGDS
jgi:hypothetical protein